MKRQLLLFGLVAAICMSGAMAANVAQATQEDARIALHITVPGKKSGCGVDDPNTLLIPCEQFVTAAPTGNIYLVYLCVAQGSAPGVGGMSCGVETDFVPANPLNYSWGLCADLEFPNDGGNGNWPATGGGNRITWNAATNCQTTELGGGIQAVAGYFYIYNYYDDQPLSFLRITSNNNVAEPELQVADCNAVSSDLPPLAAGGVEFGAGEGYNPCGAVPVEAATWGSLKQQFD